MKSKSVVIIGAGIGGLASAILLARKGISVTIYEKNRQAGGRCGQIAKDGHIFDTGPTMYLFPQLFSRFFTSINENPQDYFRLLPVNPTYRLHYPDHTHLTLTSDFKKLRSQLERLEPGSYRQFLRYLEVAKAHYHQAMTLVHLPLNHAREYFNLPLVISLLHTGALLPHHWYTRQFFKHPHLQTAFTFQDSYLSLNPYSASAIYSLFVYSELTEGSFLPQGGMYQIINALTQTAQKSGVKLIFDSAVRKINLNQSAAKGVTLTDSTFIPADFILANADLSYVYQNLLPPEPFTHKLKRFKYSCSAMVFHWALDKKYPHLLTHNLYFSHPHKENFDQVINRRSPPSHPHFYLQAPTRTDPSRAPTGQDTLTVIVPINHLDPSTPVDWQCYQTHLRQYIFTRLYQSGYPDVANHLKFELNFTPLDWQNRFNLTHGSVYGLHHNFFQLGYFRPHRQHPKYRNLFFVGSSTHPGSGLPTVLNSAQFTSNLILNLAT